ncbi:MAG: hypothetical protein SVY15_03515 [Halobacteriota archaeon]|nr:hypothetical protein [Halobacteriota archaeon]
MNKISFIVLFLMVALLVTPSALAKNNFVETYISGIPETVGVSELVNMRINLDEVSSDLTSSANLTFKTSLEDPSWVFSFVGGLETKSEASSEDEVSIFFNHTSYDNLSITLTGLSPSYEKRKTLLLLKIEQSDEITGKITNVIDPIWVDVTTGEIEDVRTAQDESNEIIEVANGVIENASSAGANVYDVQVMLELARQHNRKSNELYIKGDVESALMFANYAKDNASKAIDLSEEKMKELEERQEFVELRNNIIIVVIVISIVIVAIMLYRRREWDKLGR